MKKRLVISAINFSEGGPLTILRDAVTSAVETLGEGWEVIVLAHDRRLLHEAPVKVLEFPRSKRSWGLRLFYEWFLFNGLSKELKPDLWLSLHDITPRVVARRQAVYCHNSAPFYRMSLAEGRMEPTLLLFRLFYRHLYRAFIHRNRYVIVQQDWLREAFRRMFGSLDILVAHPQVNIPLQWGGPPAEGPFVFFYPALPRVFKNFELIADAVDVLVQRGCGGFEVRLTLSGDENAYARRMRQRFSHLHQVRLIGRQNGAQMANQYAECSAVLFPSRLETWGLPISEAKAWRRPLLVADLPYALETVGAYDQASFVDVADARQLADQMQAMLEGRWQPKPVAASIPGEPYAANWPRLWSILTDGL